MIELKLDWITLEFILLKKNHLINYQNYKNINCSKKEMFLLILLIYNYLFTAYLEI